MTKKNDKKDVGLFIPAEVLKNNELLIAEKMVYSEILQLHNIGQCTASNQHFADRFGMSRAYVTKIFAKLDKLKYITTAVLLSGKKVIKRTTAPAMVTTVTNDGNHSDHPMVTTGTRDGNHSMQVTYSISNNNIVTPEVFIEYWNSKGTLPKIQTFNLERKKQLKSRCSAAAFAENWKQIIDKGAASDFCTGKTPPTPGHKRFYMRIDWLLKNDTNWPKVLEGNFDNAEPAQTEPTKAYAPGESPLDIATRRTNENHEQLAKVTK